MISWKQFRESVTGSDLNPKFRKSRLIITACIALFLLALISINGLTSFHAGKTLIERERGYGWQNMLEKLPGWKERFVANEQQRRSEQIIELRQNIITQSTVLLVLLVIAVWFLLYWLLKPLSEEMQKKEEFVRHASHELRTPLAVLMSQLQLLEGEKNLTNIESTRIAALAEIKRLSQLSSAILQEDTQLTQHNSTKIQVKSMIESIIAQLKPLNTKSIQFEVVTQHPLFLYTNPEYLHQILFNLIDNIQRYSTHQSSATITIASKSIQFKSSTSLQKIQQGVGTTIAQKRAEELGFLLESTLKNQFYTSALFF